MSLVDLKRLLAKCEHAEEQVLPIYLDALDQLLSKVSLGSPEAMEEIQRRVAHLKEEALELALLEEDEEEYMDKEDVVRHALEVEEEEEEEEEVLMDVGTELGMLREQLGLDKGSEEGDGGGGVDSMEKQLEHAKVCVYMGFVLFVLLLTSVFRGSRMQLQMIWSSLQISSKGRRRWCPRC